MIQLKRLWALIELKALGAYLITSIYLFNIVTISFIAVLFTPTKAFAGLPQPVPLAYSCQSGYTYTQGKCYKYHNTAPVVSCTKAGYSVVTVNGLQTCAKSESRSTINSCPVGTNWLDTQKSWDYHDPLYPQSCSERTSAASQSDCPAGTTSFANGICFKLATPYGKTCPDEGGNSESVEQTCPQTYIDLGVCNAGETVKINLPDQSWHKASESICQRTLYEGAIKQCPAGHILVDDDVCQETLITEAVVGCPVGYYQDGAQCYPGAAPSCPAGTTLVNGICANSSGNTECPSNKERDPITGTCVSKRDGLSDQDYYLQLGRDIGSSAVKSAALPSNGTTGTQLNYRNVGQTQFQTTTMSDSDMLGLDSNNGYNVSASGTYMDNDAQQAAIKEAVERNTDYAESEAVVGATQEETNDLQDHSANAYLTLVNLQNSNPPMQIGSDASFLQAGKSEQNAILAGTGGQYFGDCTTETVTRTVVDDSLVVKTRENCFKPNRNNLSSCNRERTLKPPHDKKIFGDEGRYTFCGKKCINIKLGSDVDNNYSSEQCELFSDSVQIRIADGINITNATIGKVRWDDQYWLKVNDQTLQKNVSGSFAGGFPNESTVSCRQGHDNVLNVAQNVTTEFQSALAQSTILNINQTVAVDGTGNAFADITLQFDKDILDEWSEDIDESPDGCSAALDDPNSFCSASNWVCDARLNSDVITNSGIINLSDIEGRTGVQSTEDPESDVVILVVRRDFEPTTTTGTTENCGVIMGTTNDEADNKNDDGLWICREGIGFSTHHANRNPAMYGTKLINVIPEKQKWTTFAVRVKNGKTSEFYSLSGTKYSSSKIYNGEYDSLKNRRIIIGRGNSSEDWTKRANAPLYLAHWEVMRSASDSEVFDRLNQVSEEYDLVNLEPLFDGDDGLTPCMHAHLEDYSCDPLKGQRLPLNGGTVGYTEIRSLGDQCEQYASNERCVFNKADCADGWMDDGSNTCFGWNVSYDCENGSVTERTETVENNSCFTDTTCISGDCETKADENNTDFIQTAAMYAAINEVGNKSSCTDPNDPSTCQAFVGTEDFCGWDQLKINDCCSMKGTDTSANLFKMSLLTFSATQNAVQSKNAFVNEYLGGEYAKKGWSMVKSGWNEASSWASDAASPVTEAASSFWNFISKPFSSEALGETGNELTVAVGEAGEAISDFVTDIATSLETIKTQIFQKVYEMMPEAMQSAIVSGAEYLGVEGVSTQGGQQVTTEVGGKALEGVLDQAMSAISLVMMIYTIYNMIQLAYTMLTACTDDELKMGTNLKERKCMFVRYVPCHKVLGVCTNRAHNEYCCFNSTLARIIMEQAIVQLGYTPETWHDNESCRGITLNELQGVDFGAMDFSEWVGLMADSDMFPDPSLDTTGDETKVNNGGRENAVDRVTNQLGIEDGTSLKELYQNGSIATNIDCSVFPRPPSCPI